MQSKRDQVQAHGFMMGRLSSGLLTADPDAPESPLGRTTRGVVFGVLVTVLIGAGATVYGLLRPGGNDGWRGERNLVVNRDTGARYLWTGTDGVLHPVRNYASARLIGGSDLPTVDVATASLRDIPVGSPAGIPGAPDSLPGPGQLDEGAWHMCVTGPGGALASTSGAAGGTGVEEPGATTVVAGAPWTPAVSVPTAGSSCAARTAPSTWCGAAAGWRWTAPPTPVPLSGTAPSRPCRSRRPSSTPWPPGPP